MVVVDEWHELLGNKRGVQVQLALARSHAKSELVSAQGAVMLRFRKMGTS